MLLVVETQAADGADVLRGQGGKQQADVGHLVGYGVRAKDVAGDETGLLGGPDVGDALGEDGVAVVGAAVAGEEADETLWCDVSLTFGCG